MFKHFECVDVFVYIVYMALRLVTGPCLNTWRVLMYLSI